MSTLIGATEAAKILGVTKATLYAYVSRGLVERTTAVDGRTSLYPRDGIEALAARRTKRSPVQRPSIDVQIASGITTLSDDAVTYRGHDVATLARTASFEAVAELLWTGELPDEAPAWRADRGDLARCRDVVSAAGVTDPIGKLTLAAITLGTQESSHSNEHPLGGETSAAPIARRLLAIAPSLLGGTSRGSIAERLTRCWVRRPSPQLESAVERALILLADHELATSTLAVRVAASVRTEPGAALACGLATVGGNLHGRASQHTLQLFQSAEASGARQAVDEWLSREKRLPGFGHSVYRMGDPRYPVLMESIQQLDDPTGRREIVAAILLEAGRRIDRLPNIDYALAALGFIADLPADNPIFAVARIAGWAAHHDEELGERPVRYRGMTRAR